MKIDDNTYRKIKRSIDWLEETITEVIIFVAVKKDELASYEYEVFNTFSNNQIDLVADSIGKLKDAMSSGGPLAKIEEIPGTMAREDPRLFREIDNIEGVLTTLFVRAKAISHNTKAAEHPVIPDDAYDKIYGEFRKKLYHKLISSRNDFANEIKESEAEGDIIGYGTAGFITEITEAIAKLAEEMDANFKELSENIDAVQTSIKNKGNTFKFVSPVTLKGEGETKKVLKFDPPVTPKGEGETKKVLKFDPPVTPKGEGETKKVLKFDPPVTPKEEENPKKK